MFVAVGITLLSMVSMLHSKTTENSRNWAALAVKLDGLLPFSVILIIVPGLYLVFSSWGWKNAWIDFSLALMILMTFMGPIINLRRLKTILHAAKAEKSSVPTNSLLEKVRDRVLWNSVLVMTMLAFAIVFLMTVKVAMTGSIITIVVVVILGFVAANILLSKGSASMTSNKKNTRSI